MRVVFVSNECTKWKHIDMETNPSIVDITTSLYFLFFHGISVPLQVIFQPPVDAISVHDAKVSKSIIGEIENLEFAILCLHEVICHDCDEALRIIMHSIQDILLRHFIEFNSLINHQVQ